MRKINKCIKVFLILIIFLFIFGIIFLTIKISKTRKIQNVNEKTQEYEEKYTIAEYEIIKQDAEKITINVIMENRKGIESIACPNLNTIYCNGKEKISFDYNVIENQEYNFKVKIENENETNMILNVNANDKPEIMQNQSYAYPDITEYGISISKRVIIDYGEYTNNYYSLDNGKNWIKYQNYVNIKGECILVAKSISENTICKKSKEEIKLNLADDAMGAQACDENDSTYYEVTRVGITNRYMNIEENMQGKTISIHVTNPRLNYMTVYFYDNSENKLSTVLDFPYTNGVASNTKTVKIPDGAVKMECEIYENSMIGTYI